VLGLLLLFTISLGIYYTFGPTPYKVLSPKTGSLLIKDKNAIQQVGTNEEVTNAFTKSGEGTIAVFLYINPLQRTPVLENPDNVNVNTAVTLFKLVNIYNEVSLAFVAHPSGKGVNSMTSELQIRTEGGTIETLKFKPILLQKWVYVTISRRGRRYNIFFNSEQVASFRTKDYPKVETVKWIIGDETVASNGTFAYPMITEQESTIKDVKERLAAFADSRDKPILPKASIVNPFAGFNLGGCPSGIFCFGSGSQPNSPLDSWTTPFA
jgi:hypothetical protein